MSADKDTTFGRRGAAPAGSPASLATSSGQAPSSAGNWSGLIHSRLAKQFAGILAGVGILLGLHAIYVVSMKGFGRALDQHWQQNVGYPGLEDAYLRTKTRDAGLEEAHNNCIARAAFVRLGQAEQRALEGFGGLYSGESALAKSALYLSCLMAQKPPRFCQPAHCAHLIAALADYYKLMAKVHEERWLQTTSPFALERAHLINPRPSGAASAPPSAQTDPRVIDGLRSLVGAGYLTQRDLSALPRAAAAELEGRLRGLEGKRAECT